MGIENSNINESQAFDTTNIKVWQHLHKEARKLFKDNPEDIDGNVAVIAEKYGFDPELLKKKFEKKGYYKTEKPIMGNPDKETDEPAELSPEKYDLMDEENDAETSISSILGPGTGQSQPTKRPIQLLRKNDNAPDGWEMVTAIYRIPIDWEGIQNKYGGGSYQVKELMSDGKWRVIRDDKGHPMLPVTIAQTLEQKNPVVAQNPSQSTKENLDIMGAMTSVLKNTMEITLNSAKPSQDFEKFKLDQLDKAHEREMQLQKQNMDSQKELHMEIMKRYDERLADLSKQKSGGLLGNLKEISSLKTELSQVLQMLGYSAVETIKHEEESSKFWTFAKNLTNNPLFAEKIGDGINGLLGGLGLLLAGFAAKAQGKTEPAAPASPTPPAEQKQIEQPKPAETKEVAKKDDLIVQGYHVMIKKLNVIIDSKRLTYDQYLWFMEGMEVPMYYPVQIAKLDELIAQLGASVKASNKEQFEQTEKQIRNVFLTDFDFSPSLKVEKKDKDGKTYEEINPNVEVFLNRFIEYSLPQDDSEGKQETKT